MPKAYHMYVISCVFSVEPRGRPSRRSPGKFWPVTHASVNRAGAPRRGVGAAPVGSESPQRSRSRVRRWVPHRQPCGAGSVSRTRIGSTGGDRRRPYRLRPLMRIRTLSRCGTGRPHSARRLRKIEDGKCREGFSKGRHRASMRPSAPPCGAYSGNISANTSPRS